jgi:hypothetical protein
MPDTVLLPLLKELDAPGEPREGSHTLYSRKRQPLASVIDHVQSLQRSAAETPQMHAGICHAFVHSAEAILPVNSLFFWLQY